MGRYLIGIIMIFSGVLLLLVSKGKEFKEVEQSLVMAYSFLIFGLIYIAYKKMFKR